MPPVRPNPADFDDPEDDDTRYQQVTAEVFRRRRDGPLKRTQSAPTRPRRPLMVSRTVRTYACLTDHTTDRIFPQLVYNLLCQIPRGKWTSLSALYAALERFTLSDVYPRNWWNQQYIYWCITHHPNRHRVLRARQTASGMTCYIPIGQPPSEAEVYGDVLRAEIEAAAGDDENVDTLEMFLGDTVSVMLPEPHFWNDFTKPN
jgi:hypothetical protein